MDEAQLAQYRAGLDATRAALAADPALMADGRRYGTHIDHLAATAARVPAGADAATG